MQTIFVMIKCDLGTTYEVAEHLVDEIEEARGVHSISGDYDLLVQFVLPATADVGHFVCETVQTIPHIHETFTLIALNAFAD